MVTWQSCSSSYQNRAMSVHALVQLTVLAWCRLAGGAALLLLLLRLVRPKLAHKRSYMADMHERIVNQRISCLRCRVT